MKDQLETCKNCLFVEIKLCNNPGSERYDTEASPNGSCSEWESKLKW